jgi:uncharacterized protein (DUF362 family)
MTADESKGETEPRGGESRSEDASASQGISRRKFLTRAGIAVAVGVAAKSMWDHFGGSPQADVAILKAPSYDRDLTGIIMEGFSLLGLVRDRVRGKSVLLKPNLVGQSRGASHINTHPAVVRAAAEAFRRLDAREILVAEGQGNCTDSDLVLDQSGAGTVLAESHIPFIDVNHDEVVFVQNRLGATPIKLYLPSVLRRVDLIVSMPKLKTHHWAGVTLSMKNLFGLMPGAIYGWPKSILHNAGIDGSILDITAAVSPHLAIIDGVVGMEGDGPIMGSPRETGVLVMGANLPAVDVTATRLMGFDPYRVPYLAAAAELRFGPIAERRIRQRGESIKSMAQAFDFPNHPALLSLRDV